MSRHPTDPTSSLTQIGPRQRAVLASAALLSLVLVGALLLPERGDPDEGSLTPAAEPAYAPRAEIERALAEEGQVRCAVFEEQRYCLGIGWTTRTAAEEQARITTERAGRRRAVETTGDLTTSDLLAQRAAMPTAQREEAERAELEEAARSVAKVVMLRHEILGEPLPDGFSERHPQARAAATSAAAKGFKDYPRRDTVLNPKHIRAQRRTYWCGPGTMQSIAWGWQKQRKTQQHWARRLGTTTSGSAISEMVRVVNGSTGYDRADRAGKYVVLDISDWKFKQWMLLQLRHVHDYRAPLVLHPILLKKFYPYLDDDASGHFQVGRGYDKNGRKPGLIGYFEPWNQQRFDPSEPYIARVQWRRAYNSFRANKAHPHQNIGV
ncbi:hypothetical protein GCM10009623_14930 [Nocardioides aestuarii]|uniref:Papain-like cysteine protease family protein n=1 Tax=Nocardioides aestuarii TaxID=252231 RepID=A0ABW4TLM6_9ACTN